jgi:hypothetical protein
MPKPIQAPLIGAESVRGTHLARISRAYQRRAAKRSIASTTLMANSSPDGGVEWANNRNSFDAEIANRILSRSAP